MPNFESGVGASTAPIEQKTDFNNATELITPKLQEVQPVVQQEQQTPVIQQEQQSTSTEIASGGNVSQNIPEQTIEEKSEVKPYESPTDILSDNNRAGRYAEVAVLKKNAEEQQPVLKGEFEKKNEDFNFLYKRMRSIEKQQEILHQRNEFLEEEIQKHVGFQRFKNNRELNKNNKSVANWEDERQRVIEKQSEAGDIVDQIGDQLSEVNATIYNIQNGIKGLREYYSQKRDYAKRVAKSREAFQEHLDSIRKESPIEEFVGNNQVE